METHDFVFRLSDLDNGRREYEGRLADAFFAESSEWEILGGAFEVTVEARSDGEVYLFDVQMEGVLRLPCDRCLEPFDLPLEYEGRLTVVRAGTTGPDEFEGDEWRVGSETRFVDLKPYLRESIYLSVPMRHYHGMLGTDETACLPEMRNRIGRVDRQVGDTALGAALSALLKEE